MLKDRLKLIGSIFYPILFVMLLWIIKYYEILYKIKLTQFGILPRDFIGLRGVIVAPLIHGDMYHLFSNSLPLIILGVIIFSFYRRIAFPVFFIIYFFSNILVWLIATGKGYHLGASGLIYGFVSFLFFSGIFRTDKKSMLLSLFVVLVYGGLIWGLFPLQDGVSWESHFFGAIIGGVSAFAYRKKDFQNTVQVEVPAEERIDYPDQEI
ncbi:MAG: rhomboid family intramembrane serine protease [Cytophagaceae bacterium]|nr:rhomboid family intramembrane serine protease [Cytophagaceae bacterium]